jgi:hypothetical protein
MVLAMSVRVLQPMYARSIARTNAAGQTGELGLETDEGLRLAVLRLAVNRLCPTGRDVLVGATITALRGLVPSQLCGPSDVDSDIDLLIASGDLLIGNDVAAGKPRAQVFQAPPMFVRRSGGSVFVIGGLPEQSSPFRAITRPRGPFRELVPPPSEQELADAGYTAYPIDVWMESPALRTPSDLVDKLDALLDATGNAGELIDLEVIDPTADRGFYRGRWTAPKTKTGRFLARRKRKWGGRGWGYADVTRGQAVRFRTFPAIDGRFRGCDETWWAICAMDALAGAPQPIEVREIGDAVRLGFTLPLPMWAERRLLSVGTIADTRPRGTLLAYDISVAEAEQEIDFLTTRLWMEPRTQKGDT